MRPFFQPPTFCYGAGFFSSGNNRINVSNQVINAGDGWRKGLGAANVMLRQVWQMSDTAVATICVPDPLVLSLVK